MKKIMVSFLFFLIFRGFMVKESSEFGEKTGFPSPPARGQAFGGNDKLMGTGWRATVKLCLAVPHTVGMINGCGAGEPLLEVIGL